MRRGRWQNIQQTEHIHLYSRQKSRPIYRSTIGRLSTNISNGYLLTIDQVSTECWPITDRYVGQVSTNCRRSVGERKAISAETHLERLSTECRPTIDRYVDPLSTECRPTIDQVSTDYWPTVDRRSTDCRPLYRPIDQSTLPTVNMIRYPSRP